MPEMSYEMLVRRAFGFSTGVEVNRSGDPASLADADHFRNNNIVGVKIGTGYAMEIFISHIQNNKNFDEVEYTWVKEFPARIIKASSTSAIAKIIKEFESTVLAKYFHVDEGNFVLKTDQ